MSDLEARLGPAWPALSEEAGAAAFRLLKAFAELAERPKESWTIFRASKADVLVALSEQEGKPLSDASLRQRILTLNTASETLADSPDLASQAFKVRSERSGLVLEFNLADDNAGRRQALARTRELAIGSTEALISTRGLDLQEPQGEPAQRTYQIMVHRPPSAGAADTAIHTFLESLSEKLATPPAARRLGYRARLWWAPKHLKAQGGDATAQAKAAADQAVAALLIVNDGWPDLDDPDPRNALPGEDMLRGGHCLKILAGGDLSGVPAPLSSAPCFPLLWAQKERRTAAGKPIASLTQLYFKGDIEDQDGFVTHVRDEILALLDAIDSGSAAGDRTRAKGAQTAQVFMRGAERRVEQTIVEKMQEARGTRAEGEGEPEDLLPLLEAWACGEGIQSRIFALLGSFGTGKTTTAHMFADRLVKRRQTDPSTPFPILLDLKRLADVFNTGDPAGQSMPELMVRSLDPEHARSIDPDGLIELLRSEPCVVIFDGVDEVGTRLGVEQTARLYSQLLDIIPRAVWNQEAKIGAVDWDQCATRLMVTCRTQFFETYVQQKAVLTGHHRHTAGPIAEGDVHTTTYYMAPLRPDQVLDYFEIHLGVTRGRDVYRAIEGVGDLKSLVEKPLMTRYIAELAPVLLQDIEQGRNVNAGLVYQRLFEAALARDSFKRTVMTIRDRQALLEALAEVLWRRRTPVITLRDLETWFDDYMAASPALRNILRSGVEARSLLLTELRNASLLMRHVDDGFAFDHTSFFEYFLARRLLAVLLDGSFGEGDDPPPISEECLLFLGNLIEFENVADAVARALAGVFLSRRPAYRALAVRIAGAFRVVRPDWTFPPGTLLSDLDLRDLQFTADGRNPRRFSRVSFAGSNLLSAGFKDILFEGCDFAGANLSMAQFENCAFIDCVGAALGTASVRATRCRIDPGSRVNVLSALQFDLPSRLPPPSGLHARGAAFHLLAVTSAVFSPDGTQVLTASYDRTARLSDRSSGAEIARFSGHDHLVSSAVFSPDGTQVLTASHDKVARLFDRASGAEIARISGHDEAVTSAVFSPAGTQVLTASYDRTAKLFDRASGAEIARFSGHDQAVASAVFSPDGTQVLTASHDRTARLFDLASSAEIACFSGHDEAVTSAVFSPDGTQVLTASYDRTAKLFDRASGAEIARFSGHDQAVASAVFSPDGTQVLTASWDQTVRLFDRASGAEIARISGHDEAVTSAVFSPDGTQVLTASDDHTARLFDRASGAEIARFSGHDNWVRSAVFSPDGTQVLTAADDRTAKLFDRVTGAEITLFAGHGRAVNSAVFSPDGNQVLTASNDHTAGLFDRATGAEIVRFSSHDHPVNSAVFSPDGSLVLTASHDGTARLFDRASGAEIVRFSTHDDAVTSAVFSPDGTQVLTASHDGTARLFDRASGTEIARFSGHDDWVRSAVFSPDGTQVLTAADDRTARLFDRVTGTEIARFSGHDRVVISAVFSPNGTQVLTASADHTARLFDRASGAEIARFSGHDDWVRCAVFSPDGTQVLTASDDQTVRLFDRATGVAQGGLRLWTDAWAHFDAQGDLTRGGGALWKYAYGLDLSDPSAPRIVGCPPIKGLD
jgi:WD40 repeat protein